MHAPQLLTPAIRDRLTNWWEGGEQATPCLLGWVTPEAQDTTPVEDLAAYWMDPETVIDRAMERMSRFSLQCGTLDVDGST